MNTLVYGAGVIGCFLAHALCKAGNEVTLLARGTWKETLEQDGLVIRHTLQHKTTRDRPKIVASAGDAPYDVAFAVMQYGQMLAALDDLAQINAPILVLVGNNLSAVEMEARIKAQSPKKVVLFGFQGTAGCREDGRLECVRAGGGSMHIGALHGGADPAVRAKLEAAFSGCGYRLRWEADMDGWLKSHLAFILPIAYLSYTVECDLRRSTRKQRGQTLEAALEAERLLISLGVKLPKGEPDCYEPGLGRALLKCMLAVMAKTRLGELAVTDHCRHAAKEMAALDEAWRAIRAQRPDVSMSAWDGLRDAMPPWDELCAL